MKNKSLHTPTYSSKIHSFGELEIIENEIYKVIIHKDVSIEDTHLKDFEAFIDQAKVNQYGIILNITNPLFCSNDIALKFSEDIRLKAIALMDGSKEKLKKSKLFMELGSLLPNPLKIPVKPFKNEMYAVMWLRRLLGKE